MMCGEDSRYNCVVVCGPTATGKTRLAVRLAAWLGGEVLSADSRQVYRGMDIGTGKDMEEYENGGDPVPYHLIDVADPVDGYSLWNYQRDFHTAFSAVRGRGGVPVVAGGTGLYIEAVLKGYEIADVPENEALREDLMKLDRDGLIERLRRLDEDLLERTDVSSKKRVVRALEVGLERRNAGSKGPVAGVEWPEVVPLVLAVRMEREVVRARIRKRLEERLEEGMVEEVRGLMAGGVSRERMDRLGMEYGQVARYLAGEVSREEMVEALYFSICRLAKRQATWFRGMERRGLPVTWLEGPDFDRAREVIGGSFSS